jgi:hypothetical protein
MLDPRVLRHKASQGEMEHNERERQNDLLNMVLPLVLKRKGASADQIAKDSFISRRKARWNALASSLCVLPELPPRRCELAFQQPSLHGLSLQS